MVGDCESFFPLLNQRHCKCYEDCYGKLGNTSAYWNSPAKGTPIHVALVIKANETQLEPGDMFPQEHREAPCT